MNREDKSDDNIRPYNKGRCRFTTTLIQILMLRQEQEIYGRIRPMNVILAILYAVNCGTIDAHPKSQVN